MAQRRLALSRFRARLTHSLHSTSTEQPELPADSWWRLPLTDNLGSTGNTGTSGDTSDSVTSYKALFYQEVLFRLDTWWRCRDETVSLTESLRAQLDYPLPEPKHFRDFETKQATKGVDDAQHQLWKAWWALQHVQTQGEKMGIVAEGEGDVGVKDLIARAQAETQRVVKEVVEVMRLYAERSGAGEMGALDEARAEKE